MNEHLLPPASELSVLYALPVPQFYSQIGGVGGHVAHANGIMKSIVVMGATLDVLAEEVPTDPLNFVNSWNVLPCSNCNIPVRYFWGKKFVEKVSDLASGANYSFCYMRYSTQFAPHIPAMKKALGRTPLVLELNSFAAQRSVLEKTILGPIEKRAFKAPDLILCVSNPLKEDVDRVFGQTLDNNVFVVPNGVDPERFMPVFERADGAGSKINLCYCGVLKKGYGLDHLLETHKKLEAKYPNLVLHIIGDGPRRDSLEKFPGRGVNVVFHGAIGFRDVPVELAKMDILVYTTSRDNAFQSPIKLYEYMCTGRPIVAADTPQIRSVLQGENPCGLLFDVENLSHLYDSIAKLLVDPDLGVSLATQARQVVVANHHWDQRMASIRQELERRGILHV